MNPPPDIISSECSPRPMLLKGENRLGMYLGWYYRFSARNDVWFRLKGKQTYLEIIKIILSENNEFMDYNTLIEQIKINWGENNIINERSLKTALRKGIKDNIIIQADSTSTQYKDQKYKLTLLENN